MRRLVEEKNKILIGVDSDYTERYWKPKRKSLSGSLQSVILGTYRVGSGYRFLYSLDRTLFYGQFHRSRFNDKRN